MVHWNHEARPYEIPSYREGEWHSGHVYYEEEYPDLLFAKDGEIYDFDGKRGIVIGGAYSVDDTIKELGADEYLQRLGGILSDWMC